MAHKYSLCPSSIKGVTACAQMLELESGGASAGRASHAGDRRRHGSRRLAACQNGLAPTPAGEHRHSLEGGRGRSWLAAGIPGWHSLEFVPEKEGKPGDLPAFRFARLARGTPGEAALPGAAFGLDLADTQVTDAGLKELAGLKSLQSWTFTTPR